MAEKFHMGGSAGRQPAQAPGQSSGAGLKHLSSGKPQHEAGTSSQQKTPEKAKREQAQHCNSKATLELGK